MARFHLESAPVLLASALAAASSLVAQAPKTLDQIPVYAGATRVPDREAEEQAMGEGGYGDATLVSDQVRVYQVAAPLEEVARFYQQRLGAREIRSEDEWERAYPENVGAGQGSPVLCQFEPVDLGPESGMDDVAAVRAAYTKARAPFRPGVWLAGGDFRWIWRESETRYTEFNLVLQDTEAFEITTPDYHNETEVLILVRTWDESGAAGEREAEPSPVTPMAPPTEAQLGVPLYPGARFDGMISAQMTAGDDTGTYYVFASGDPVSKIQAFYEQRTGKKGLVNEGGVLIAVQGEGLFPDLGVAIQPNVGTFPPPAQSMITVRRRK